MLKKEMVEEIVAYAKFVAESDPDFSGWDNYDSFAESVQRQEATEDDYRAAFEIVNAIINFPDRIKHDALIPYINLNDDESEHYHGSGYALAFVKNGQIEQLLYIHDIPEDGAKDVIQVALNHGNAWFGMCGSYQFSEPRKFDEIVAAKVMRLVAGNYDLDGEDSA